MPDVNFISALIGGLLTFLAPCTLPLIPAYLAFIGGSSVDGRKTKFSRHRFFLNAVLFVLGFSVVFIVFGLASGTLGKFLVLNRLLISQVGGVLICFFGLSLLGVFPKMKGFSYRPPAFISSGSPLGGFALGFLFALGWSPCLGPILGTILILASTGGTAFSGALLLATYSLGLAIPFLLVALLYGSAFTYVAKLQTYLPTISKIGAVLIIAIGMLLIVGQFGILNSWAQYIIGPLALDRFMDFM